MKVKFRFLGDPFFHLTALAAIGGTVYVLSEKGHPTGYMASGHRADCHTCSQVPQGASASTERFLARHAFIEPTGD